MDTSHKGIDAEKVLGRKMDHRIINAALNIQDLEPEKSTILVTKDINLRLKAKALHLKSEDYLTVRLKTWMPCTKAVRGREFQHRYPHQIVRGEISRY